MPPTDDIALLRQFATDNSEAAFTTLVARHIGLVHSAALRQTGNPHAAEEITQAVFIILARKAGSLGGKVVLPGWLYQTTRLTAANHLRTEIRRARREQEAYMQSTLNEPADEAAWQQIAPLLDTAMGGLNETDRNAIVLRFFENKSMDEIAAALDAPEATVRKRVTRAVEQLRKFFTQRGVTLTAAVIAGAVSANSVQAAPVGLVKTISVVVAAQGAGISAAITTLVKGTMKTMTWLKLKFAVGLGAAALLAGGVTTVALSGDSSGSAVGSTSSTLQMRIVLDAASADSEILTQSVISSKSGKVFQVPLQVQKQILLDQSAIASASVTTNPIGGQVEIEFVLTPKGKEQFAKITRENIDRKLAIIIDGKVISAPVIRSEIPGGKGQISGDFTEQEARNMAARISKPARN